MSEKYEDEERRIDPENTFPDMEPIEPEGKRINRQDLLKWAFFLLALVYILLSYYHAPILIHLGRYLIVEHDPQKCDLIVCMAGGNIERGLAAAEAYEKGFAPHIYISKEEPPDGYELLKNRDIDYPESIDLMIILLEGLRVPRSAILISDGVVRSTWEEAMAVRELVERKGFRSLMVITSPFHTRRAWLTYRKVFKDLDVRILMNPSKYSGFKPEGWWKERRYVRHVIIEYEKLIFYTFKYFL